MTHTHTHVHCRRHAPLVADMPLILHGHAHAASGRTIRILPCSAKCVCVCVCVCVQHRQCRSQYAPRHSGQRSNHPHTVHTTGHMAAEPRCARPWPVCVPTRHASHTDRHHKETGYAGRRSVKRAVEGGGRDGAVCLACKPVLVGRDMSPLTV